MVRVLLAKNELTQAGRMLETMELDFRGSPAVLNLQAARESAAGNFAAARAFYLKAADRDPHDLEALTGLMSLDLRAGRKNDAVARIDSALTRMPPTVELLELAGSTYADAGNPGRAAELFQQAIELDPDRLQAYGLLGQLYASQQRIDDAIDRYRQVVARDARSVPALTMLGMLYEAQGRTAEAESYYKQVVTIDSRATVASNNLAWLYVAANRNLDEALTLAEAAQRQRPDEPSINDTLGWIYYRKNMPTPAVRHLEISVAGNPRDPVTLYHLGMAYMQAGSRLKAKTTLEQALAMKPDFDGSAEARQTLQTIGG
jgi:tetratricopeptide (TPR) repeat protein